MGIHLLAFGSSAIDAGQSPIVRRDHAPDVQPGIAVYYSWLNT
jgi:hypothetical protein